MLPISFIVLLIVLGIYSYGFVDLNLHLTNNPFFLTLQKPLSDIVYHNMTLAGVIYAVLITGLYICYFRVLKNKEKDWKKMIIMAVIVLLFSFPAFTYDIFNYMTTASVAYTHKENPYIVMPVEIPGEPGLAYTRAANKVALYGPTWLLLTWIPHTLGAGHIWQTIISFKLMIAVFYGAMLYLIYRSTKSVKQVLFFGLNPLILIEVLLSGHNDIVMMVFALLSVTAVGQRRVILWLVSFLVKGATIVLLPFISWTPVMAFWLMFGIFLLTPLREELYPWYAVWFLTFAAIIPITKRSFIHGFSIALCIGLSLRHLPYILTREYGGSGPTQRLLFTVVPVILYVCWYVYKKKS